MQPIYIEIGGFRAYGDVQRVEFNPGLTAIVGANKSGKSSTFLAWMWGLYGATALRAEGITQPECLHEGMESMKVELSFALGDYTYTVVRQYKNGTTSLKLNQSVEGEDGRNDLSLGTNKETQAVIDRIVGTYEVAAQSWYCGQDADKSFMFATPGERMVTFTQLLPSSIDWGKVHKEASESRGLITAIVTETTGKVAALEPLTGDQVLLAEAVQTAADEKDDAIAAREKAEGELPELREAHTKLNTEWAQYDEKVKTKEHYDSLVTEREATYQARLKLVEDALTIIKRKDEIQLSNTQWAEAVQSWLAKKVEAGNRAIEIDQHRIALNIGISECEIIEASKQWKGALETLEDESALIASAEHCPTCERELDASTNDAMAMRLLEHKTAITSAKIAHEARMQQLNSALSLLKMGRDITIPVDITFDAPEPIDPGPQPIKNENLIRDLQDLETAERGIGGLTAEVTRTHRTYGDAVTERDAFEMPSEKPDALAVIVASGNVGDKENEVRSLRFNEQSCMTDEIRATERLGSARKAHKDLAAAQTALTDARRDESDWDLIVRGASPRGVPQLVVSQNLGAINSTINRALDILDPGTQLYLDTQKERADGAQAETLEATIVGDDGVHPFGTRSGAEKTRIAIAVRVALEVQRAQSLGTGHNATFIMDEAFGAQDHLGKENFIRFLNWLVDDLGTNVLLVTHDEEMKQRFDQAIYVSKVDGEAMIS